MTDSECDEQSLNEGDRCNVADAYHYWTMKAIVAELNKRRHSLHTAIENFESDSNIGIAVRTTSTFLVEAVHIAECKWWNCRDAMVIDRYQRLLYHKTMSGIISWAREHDLAVVAASNVPDFVPIETTELPERCLLLFDQRGSRVTEEAQQAAGLTVSITQFGSTRSINMGVAAGIAIRSWIRTRADITAAW